MIISKTPYRISFIGGGSDYPEWYLKNGGETISTSIDKYIYISIRKLDPFFKHKTRLVYSSIEEVKDINKIKHPCAKLILKHHNVRDVEIHYDGQLPARAGMGSSSSFTVGMHNLLYFYKNNKILGKKDLLRDSLNFEQKKLRENVGSQDQTIAVYGGFRNIKYKTNGSIDVQKIKINPKKLKKIENNFYLVFTNITRKASKVVSKYINNLEDRKYEIQQNLSLLNNFKKVLVNDHDLDTLGLILHESWKLKKLISPNISNYKIDEIYNNGIKSGALGGKLLGAGAGGFLLFYVPFNKKEKFLNNMKKNIITPFKFSNEGSKILKL